MNVLEHTNGKAYPSEVGHAVAEYFDFFGAPKPAIIFDWTYRRYVRCLVRSPKTPRDTHPHADPDAALAEEVLDDEPRQASYPTEALAALRQYRLDRDAELLDQLRAYLAEHGAMSAYRLAIALGVGGSERVLRVLRSNLDVFAFLGGQASVWGLVGQSYTPPRKTTRLMLALRDALMEHGPQTVRELCTHLPHGYATIQHCLDRCNDWFCIVAIREPQGHAGPTRVFGLVGVHEREK